MKALTLPALNIQAPWAQLIVSGKKTVETRFYPLPEAYVGKQMFIIETPGADKSIKRRIVGVVTFSGSFEYKNRNAFYKDRARHLVDRDSSFSWKPGDERKKWGWVIQSVQPLQGTPLPRQKTGIVFTRALVVKTIR